MSKQDRAAQTIYHLVRNHLDIENGLSKIVSTRIAQMLRKENLLAPDLPEPSRGMTPRGAVWYLPGPIGDIRRTGEYIVIFGHDYRHQSFRLVLTEAETETIARTLLAAANYSEEA
jgi:hypothetical protein